MKELTFPIILKQVISGEDISAGQAHWAFGQIMTGLWSESQIGAILAALSAKGECVDEITGAAQAMREHVVKIDAGSLETIDTCGTGGTGLSTLNISTAAAMVLAGAGAAVAKHGNRTNTRASGSADVLKALGVNIDAEPATVERCLQEAKVCFCFAIRCHPAMKYAGPVRKQLGVRTIFNVLGPLTNPAGAKRQIMGVYDESLTETIANVLGKLGSQRAMVVHADDGLDELSITSPTKISELKNGLVTTYRVNCEDFSLTPASLDDLLVDSPEQSAQIIRTVLAGLPGPARDIVILNAGAALAVAGKAEDIAAGVTKAAESIDSGAAKNALEKLIEISNT
ncbi:MAG TPA: anthranilate phosphoribosyltransferase [Phycisphaerae bacterium]|nr:anthranilate phosphoribosyltransferase [Phycisphaerae bacterium]